MRYAELIEARVPTELLAPRYFHGCKSEVQAKKILRYGLQPPDFVADGRTGDYALRPVKGRIYLTPDAKYAAMYGRYFFVINRESIVNDMQPDEDEVGDIFHWVSQKDFHDVERERSIHSDPKFLARMDKLRAPENRESVERFKHFMRSVLNPKTIDYMLHGEYTWWAKGGKQALKKMPPDMMNWLISLGVHVAHEGPVMPDEAWLLRDFKNLAADGANLAQVAKPLNFHKRATLDMPKQVTYPYKVDFEYQMNATKPPKRTQQTIQASNDKEAAKLAQEYIRHNTTPQANYRVVGIEKVAA